MIVEYTDLSSLRLKYKSKKITLKIGCYDLFHEGHLQSLEYTKGLGDILVVGLLPDKRISAKKGSGKPVIKEAARLKIIDSIKYVDYCFLLPLKDEGSSSTKFQILELLRPDLFVEHQDNFVKSQKIEDSIKKLGVKLVEDKREKIESTSEIISRIIKRLPGSFRKKRKI